MFPFLPWDIFEVLRHGGFPRYSILQYSQWPLIVRTVFLQCMRDLGFDPVTTNTAMSHHISSNKLPHPFIFFFYDSTVNPASPQKHYRRSPIRCLISVWKDFVQKCSMINVNDFSIQKFSLNPIISNEIMSLWKI